MMDGGVLNVPQNNNLAIGNALQMVSYDTGHKNTLLLLLDALPSIY
jgi:hypothetical protein